MSSAGPSAWDPALTHRLRVLLHTAPLHELRLGDSRRDPELRHYDSLSLAMKVFDLVVDSAGLDREVNRERVEQALGPLLDQMDAASGLAPDPSRHEAIVDRVLGGLRNDLDRRRPFEEVYTGFEEDLSAVRRKLEFRLLVDYFHPSGSTVLRLSNEAINLYLNALELDIEDAQAAAEAVVMSQLARGRFDEAVQTARNARWQSLRFAEKVTAIIRETRRDVSRVDWRGARVYNELSGPARQRRQDRRGRNRGCAACPRLPASSHRASPRADGGTECLLGRAGETVFFYDSAHAPSEPFGRYSRSGIKARSYQGQGGHRRCVPILFRGATALTSLFNRPGRMALAAAPGIPKDGSGGPRGRSDGGRNRLDAVPTI